jgi:hypothetical protein
VRPILVSLPILLTPLSAFADDPALPTQTSSPTAVTVASGERVTMPAKRFLLRADVNINLTSELAGKPISIAPDLWYGFDDKLTLGLVHSFVGQTGFLGVPGGASLCFNGTIASGMAGVPDTELCDVYGTVGAVGRYTLKQDAKMAIAAEGGLFARSFDPFAMAIKLGVAGRYRVAPKIAVDFQPGLFFGVTERDGTLSAGTGNGEILALPVTGIYTVNKEVSVLLQTGLILPFQEAGDSYLVPLTIGGSYAVNKQISVYGAFSLPALIGGGDATGFDARAFTLGGGYAL